MSFVLNTDSITREPRIARHIMHVMSIVLLLASLSQLLNGTWIHAKARLAQLLIAEAWESTRTGNGQPHKPWPWADTWPVAHLRMGKQPPHDLYVLAGAQGNSLAFGPGHLRGSAEPGTVGVSIVGGHRDTHFSILKDLPMGSLITVTPRHGAPQQYRITDKRVADSLTEPLAAMPYASQLILVTCYPFNAIQRGPLRYVVTAELLNDSPTTQL